MTGYLCRFFNEHGYQQQDADSLLCTFRKITDNRETLTLWKQAISLYNNDYRHSFSDILRIAKDAADSVGIHRYTAELLMCICLTERLEELYRQFGISAETYKNSVADLRYKLQECKLVYGIVGSFVSEWFGGFFNLTRFGIGRLQFEVIPLGTDYERGSVRLSADSKVINVHIPRSGDPLTEKACQEAYELAKSFFAKEIDTEPCPFVCHSWLLYPEHGKFLPKHTNTYRFFNSFDIFSSSTDDSLSELWRLFDTKEANVDRLPADTTMRRAFIEHLKNGGKTGIGRGILFV